MAQLDRAALKAFFETGDIPTESQFSDFIDSVVNFVDDGVYGWQKFTLNFDDFQPEPLDDKFIDAFFVSAGFQVNRIFVLPTTVFTGGTIASSELRFFDASDSSQFLEITQDLFTAITPTSGSIDPGIQKTDDFLIDNVSGSFIRAKLLTTGGASGIDDLTQGSVDVYYRLDKIPF